MAPEPDALTAAAHAAAQAQPAAPHTSVLLGRLRARAAADLAGVAFPSARSEAWKYANLRALSAPGWFATPAARPALSAASPRFNAPQHLAIHDGSLTAQVLDRVALQRANADCDLDDERWDALSARGNDEPFALLNAATGRDPLLIDVPAATAAGVLRIAYTTHTSGRFHCAPRVGVRLAPHSSLTLIEEITPAAGLHNALTDIEIGIGATLRHIRWTHVRGDGMSIARAFVRIADGGCYEAHQQLDIGALMRDEIDIALQGEGARARLSGVCCVGRRDQANLLVRIRHEAPRTQSIANYRGLADDHGRFAFNGRIHILPGAMDVDAALTNKNLLLSRNAEIDTKPELEIYADDVRCSHGATVGQLDAGALFYLQSRGIDAASASVLLRRGFALSALTNLAGTTEGDVLTDLLLARLEALA